MFSFDQIKEIQLEITSYCNSDCPQCPRNINGGLRNPYLQQEHLSREVIDKAFTEEICSNLDQIFFCGSYGDPIMHPEFLEILQDFRRKNPRLWLYVHTNGGAFKQDYWRSIGEIIGSYGKIDFNVDGLADTNPLYRTNTDFDQIMSNAQSYMSTGAIADWNYIVYKHNEHQVDTARELASLLGFSAFNPRSTGRFFNHTTCEEHDTWPVFDRNGDVNYYLEIPENIKYRNQSMLYLSKLKESYGSFEKYFNKTEINCDCKNRQNGIKVLINSHGVVLPCNFFNHNLEDARFYDRNIMPGSNDLSFLPDGNNQVKDLINRYNKNNELNIKHNVLSNIFKSNFWKEIKDSWNKTLDQGRIFECAMTCGSKLTKVWDQTKMTSKKYLITGANHGLGLELAKYFRGINVSRTADNNGIQADITKADDIKRIAEHSLNYDVFINNAFDGPAGESWANFAQVNVLIAVYEAWLAAGKSGYIINVGSIGEKDIVAPDPTFERYRIPKAALAHASKQCTRAFKQNKVNFKTSLLSIDRVDLPHIRERASWTGNGLDPQDVIRAIEYIIDSSDNTCIEEITAWVNYNFV
jgi:NAD(P)-dependent dehydrogenase (short-subunit alcohol dehydrogenase family)/pyruvate-formate lyase-activating enzyme